MDVRSLLNHDREAPVRSQLPPLRHTLSVSSTSSSSGYGIAPSLSPSTPELSRSDSSDSRASSHHSPSPVTPPSQQFDYISQRKFTTQPHHSPQHQQSRKSTFPPTAAQSRPHLVTLPSFRSSHMDPFQLGAASPSDNDHLYNSSMIHSFYKSPNTPNDLATPSLGQTSGMTNAFLAAGPPQQPLQQQQQMQLNHQQQQPKPQQQQFPIQPYAPLQTPLLPQQSQPSSNAASAAPSNPPPQKTKKNSYPCPIAKQYSCNEYFTTSGHAARHAKKHTGKKDAICPECGKAFTRKDNMEQHRRTHGSVRNADGNREMSEEARSRRARQQAKKQRPASISSTSTSYPSSSATPVVPPVAVNTNIIPPQQPLPVSATSSPSSTLQYMQPDLISLDPALREGGSPIAMFPVGNETTPFHLPQPIPQQMLPPMQAPTANMFPPFSADSLSDLNRLHRPQAGPMQRPTLQRSTHGHDLSHRLAPSPMLPGISTTTSSRSNSGEELPTRRLAQGLDALALAASTHKSQSQTRR